MTQNFSNRLLGWVPLSLLTAAAGVGCAITPADENDVASAREESAGPGAAGAPNESTGSTSEAIIVPEPANPYQVKAVDVGFGIKRYVRVMGLEVCIKSKPSRQVKGGYHGSTCLQYGLDFGNPAAIELFANSADVGTDRDFYAFYNHPGWQYMGCGPQAVLNVMNYFGKQVTINDCAGAVNTIDIIGNNIASLPDDVAAGLRSELRFADGNFTVQRISTDAGLFRGIIRQQLLAGNPVIMLVHNGGHYQVVTGIKGDLYHVIDYAGDDQWIAEDQLGLELGVFPEWVSVFGAGSGGYDDYTMVTVSRTPT